MTQSISTYLIVPAAGKSTRYGLDRPKFLLQHPTGVTMLEKSISGIGGLGPGCGIDRIVIVSTESHFVGVDLERLRQSIADDSRLPVDFYLLDGPTTSVVETVFAYLKSLDNDIAVILKDSDNLVEVDISQFSKMENALGFADLASFPSVSAPSKSFLEIGSEGIVTNFVEKRVISSHFSVGLTKFARASDMLATETLFDAASKELYISDIVRATMQQGQVFHSHEVRKYEDWGTLDDWLSYIATYKTLFVDIDGVVAKNGSRLGSSNNWQSVTPIEENVEFLLKAEATNRVQIIFTTARPKDALDDLRIALEGLGFKNPSLVCGLFHSQRILINDFAATNPYPSALAVNLERNSATVGNVVGPLIRFPKSQ